MIFIPRIGIIYNLGIFIRGIGDFLKSGDLYPRGLGIFENMGIFIPGIFGDGDFFV